MSVLGSRSARSEGRSNASKRAENVTVSGPQGESPTQTARRPFSDEVPSTRTPPGARPARSTSQ
ncbi:hypothetical protein ACFQYP_46415 [Nonomuraea antimicrobica]